MIEVEELLFRGHPDVVDADLADYFGSIPHAELLKSVARRIVDRRVLHLIKMWLECPVEETDDRGRKTRTTEAKDFTRLAPDFKRAGVAVVGISSNDVVNYPDDSPTKMKLEKKHRGYPFPYLVDADQSVAKAYGAASAPPPASALYRDDLPALGRPTRTRWCRPSTRCCWTPKPCPSSCGTMLGTCSNGIMKRFAQTH